MADSRFIKVVLQGENNGKSKDLKEIVVWRLTKIALLKEYISEVLCYKGSLYIDKKTLARECTLAQYNINDGDILKLNRYQILSGTSLREISITALPDGRRSSIKAPLRVKVQLLKFIIECELGILIAHQVLLKGSQLWDVNNSHECTKEDLQDLSVKDISNIPLQESPKNQKQDYSKPFFALCEDTDNGGSETIEADKQGAATNEDATTDGRAMKQGAVTNEDTAITEGAAKDGTGRGAMKEVSAKQESQLQTDGRRVYIKYKHAQKDPNPKACVCPMKPSQVPMQRGAILYKPQSQKGL